MARHDGNWARRYTKLKVFLSTAACRGRQSSRERYPPVCGNLRRTASSRTISCVSLTVVDGYRARKHGRGISEYSTLAVELRLRAHTSTRCSALSGEFARAYPPVTARFSELIPQILQECAFVRKVTDIQLGPLRDLVFEPEPCRASANMEPVVHATRCDEVTQTRTRSADRSVGVFHRGLHRAALFHPQYSVRSSLSPPH